MNNLKYFSKRGLALLLTLAMCLGMLQITAFAEEEHTHNAGGWKCTQKKELVCNKVVHDHGASCYQTTKTDKLICETEEHTHDNDKCYTSESVLNCEIEEHTHRGTCKDKDGNPICGQEEHTHDIDKCYTSKLVLNCEMEEHTHGDDCYETETSTICEQEAHQHTDECYRVIENEWDCVPPSTTDEPCTHSKHDQDGKCTECGEAVEHVYDPETHLCSCGKTDPDVPVEKPEVNPDNPYGPKCKFCGYTGWHKDGCQFAALGLTSCPECMSKVGHMSTCSQHPNSAKKHPPETSSFILTMGSDTTTVTIDQPLTKALLAENIPASKTKGGQTYLLDQVRSSRWTWYMAGIKTDSQSGFFSVEDFYDNVWREDRDFWSDIGVGQVYVEYALDADNSGIADKYQSKVTYETGNGQQTVVPYANLGFADMAGIVVPGNSWSQRYATQTTISLGNYTPSEVEGSTFYRWEIECDGTLIYSITESEDADGNTVLTKSDAEGNTIQEISSKDFENVSNLLTIIPLTIEGGKEYTVKAVFQEDIPPEIVTVTFDANGGAGTMASLTANKGDGISVPSNGFSRDGYTFTGWNTSSDGTGIAYSANDSINPDNDVTLYAQWSQNSTGGGGGGGTGGGGGGTTPTPTPTPDPTPDVDVPNPDVPLVDVPDVDVPMTELPEEVDLPEEEVPMAETPEEVEIPEEDVPLANVPKTGDISNLWYLTALLSAGILAFLGLRRRDRH